MKIRLDLNDPRSIDKALEELNRFQEKLLKFATDLVNELADEGADIAGVKFADAEYAGINDAQPGRTAIRFTKWNRKATVYVDGQSVLFIEFGTGINKAAPVGEYDEIQSGEVVDHGEYGKKRGSNPNGWYYSGPIGTNPPSDTFQVDSRRNTVHTMGNDANSSMYLTRLELEEKYSAIAQKVYERSFAK